MGIGYSQKKSVKQIVKKEVIDVGFIYKIWNLLFSRGRTQKLRVRGDVDELIRLLYDPVMIVRANAAEALWQPVGVPAPPEDTRPVEHLIWVMRNDDSGRVRRDATVALGRHWKGDPRAIQPLIKALRSDRSPDVRSAAAWALGKQGNPQAVLQPLIAALQDNDRTSDLIPARVCQDCAKALEELGDPDAVQSLREAGFEAEAKRIEEKSGY